MTGIVRTRSQRGFTLLELLVVLTVLGLISGLAATAFGGRGIREDQRLTRSVIGMLQDARAQAISKGKAVRIDLAAQAIVTESAGAPMRVILTETPRWRRTPPGANEQPIFFPDGSATPGVLELRAAGATAQVQLDWLGRVREGAANARQ